MTGFCKDAKIFIVSKKTFSINILADGTPFA